MNTNWEQVAELCADMIEGDRPGLMFSEWSEVANYCLKQSGLANLDGDRARAMIIGTCARIAIEKHLTEKK